MQTNASGDNLIMRKKMKIRSGPGKPIRERSKFNLDAIDIREVLDYCGIHYSESGKNVSRGWIGTQCPFPGCPDKSNHCGLSLTSPVVSCYACGNKGNYLTYLGVELGNFGQAIEILERFTPRELRLYKKEENEFNVIKVELPSQAVKEIPKAHADYIKSRGFDPEELTLMYDLYFCEYGKWADRIIAPIYKRNKLVTFTSIDINEDSDLRYKHLRKEESIIHTKNYLYGLEQCTGRTIAVVEGYFDKLRIGAGCVASFGTIITAHQKRLLANYDKSIIIFDGDEAGWVSGKKLADDMSSHQEVELITLEEGMDPDKLPHKDIKELQRILRTRW